jgi:hypothetical protein
LAAASLLMMLSTRTSSAQSKDTIHVPVFSNYLWLNFGTQDRFAHFPSGEQHFKKMLMRITLAAPKDSLAGRWDYTMRVWLRKNGHSYELGRFITPYGRWFRDPWSYTWTIDVTPFESLLHDSSAIRVEYEGYSQGSLFSLNFDCVTGEPPYMTYEVDSLWDGVFSYGDSAKLIAATVLPRKMLVDNNAGRVFLRILTSGHGGGGTDNAAEFSDKTHTIVINDSVKLTQHLWRTDCGENPVSPQAGTWYYSRAGWCPGDVVQPWDYDITSMVKPGDSVSIDYQFQPYINHDPAHPASYIVSGQLLIAHKPTSTRDVAVEAIIKPNISNEYWRENPVCLHNAPEIILRNLGSETLTSIRIDYGVDGNRSNRYDWHGSLVFMDTAQVILPSIDLANGTHLFSVLVSDPNGKFDEDPSNNMRNTTYMAPSNFTGPVTLTMQVDKVPTKDSVANSILYNIYDAGGAHLFSNGGFVDSAFVRDTFALPSGCYRFVIQDTGMSQGGGDGLFPIYPGASRGFYFLKDAADRVIDSASAYNHRANFGTKKTVTFNVSGGESKPFLTPAIKVTSPKNGKKITVDCSSIPYFGSQFVELELIDLNGKVIQQMQVDQKMMPDISVDVRDLARGLYVARIESMTFRSSRSFNLH